jgi:hypothetical protein
MISVGSSPGTNLNRLMDSMGFPEQLGDLMGAALDARVGNNAGVARNLFDAFASISTSTLDSLKSVSFGPPAFLARPHVNYPHYFNLHHSSHYEPEQISTYNMKPFDMGDPKLRATVEAQIGGRIVYHGNADGRITVAHKLPHRCMPYESLAKQNVSTMLARCTNSVAQQTVLQSLGAALRQLSPAFDAAAILNNASLNFDQKLSQLIQGTMRPSLEEILRKVEQLLEGEAIQMPAPPRKKKKKKGIGAKLKKSASGIKKGMSKLGKVAKSMTRNLMKGTIKTLSGGLFKNKLFSKLLSGNLGMIFRMGSGILGGILGGPVGPAMIAQFASGKLKPKALMKAANPLNQFKMFINPKKLVTLGMDQAFGQMTGMFQIANRFSNAMMDVQKQAYTKFLRG